jgi:predicted short-subunit dehydrogenase-like oxidoreductase (DUF2520 family)
MHMRERLSIVGAGRAGCALAQKLRERGWKICAVVTRSSASARQAVRAIGGGQPFATITPEILEANVVLLAAPDDALAGIARKLGAEFGPKWQGKVALHLSGALEASVLAPLAHVGAAVGSMHPLQTFNGTGTPELRGVLFGVEGDKRATRVARGIVRALGAAAVEIGVHDKAKYHAGAVMAAGHGAVLMEAASLLLRSSGFTERQARRALLRLTRRMLENFEVGGGPGAWTGPLARGDYKTIARHERALRTEPREIREAYAALSHLGSRLLAKDAVGMKRRLNEIFGKQRQKKLHKPKGGKK